MAEPKPTEASSTMSARATQLLRSFRRTFELLDEHKKFSPHEFSVINAAIAAHLRSSDPMAAVHVPSVEMPVVASPVVAAVEPATNIKRDLEDDRGYEMTAHLDGERCVTLKVWDDSTECIVVGFVPATAVRFGDDWSRVLAAIGVKR